MVLFLIPCTYNCVSVCMCQVLWVCMSVCVYVCVYLCVSIFTGAQVHSDAKRRWQITWIRSYRQMGWAFRCQNWVTDHLNIELQPEVLGIGLGSSTRAVDPSCCGISLTTINFLCQYTELKKQKRMQDQAICFSIQIRKNMFSLQCIIQAFLLSLLKDMISLSSEFFSFYVDYHT